MIPSRLGAGRQDLRRCGTRYLADRITIDSLMRLQRVMDHFEQASLRLSTLLVSSLSFCSRFCTLHSHFFKRVLRHYICNYTNYLSFYIFVCIFRSLILSDFSFSFLIFHLCFPFCYFPRKFFFYNNHQFLIIYSDHMSEVHHK